MNSWADWPVLRTFGIAYWRHDTQHNDNKHNDNQQNANQHNDNQHNDNQHNDNQHNDIQHYDIQHNDPQHKELLCDAQHELCFYVTLSIIDSRHKWRSA